MRRRKEVVMALELVFECPRTLCRLRNGPLGELLDGFCNWLLSHGYRRGTIRKHLFNLSHLNEHLGGPSSGFRENLTLRDVAGFLKTYSLLYRRQATAQVRLRRVRYSTNRFLDYLRESGLLDPSSCQKILSWEIFSSRTLAARR